MAKKKSTKTKFNIGDKVKIKNNKVSGMYFEISSIKLCDDGTVWYNTSTDEDNPVYFIEEELER